MSPDFLPIRPATPDFPPIRSATPSYNPPQAIAAADEPSAFDVIPGEAIDRNAFLSEPWALQLSERYHFKLTFGGSYYVASMVNRTALVLSKNDDDILLVFSDNNSRKRRETVKSSYLAPTPVRRVTKDLEVAIIYGEKQGQVFRVKSINKMQESAKLLSADRGQCEEQLCNLCIVVCHEQIGCDCTL